jgi:hypothetical protein
LHVVKVAIDGIDIGVLEGGSDPRQDMLIRIKVIGVQEAHDVARGQRNSLVERVVDAVIGLGHEDADRLASIEQYGQGSVARRAIDNDVLDVRADLALDRTNRLIDRGNGIEYRGERQISSRLLASGCLLS